MICHFSPKRNRKKEKSVVSFTHEQNIICSQTQSRPQCLRPGQYGYIVLVTRARCWGTPLLMSFMYKRDHWSAWLYDSSIIKLSLIFFLQLPVWESNTLRLQSWMAAIATCEERVTCCTGWRTYQVCFTAACRGQGFDFFVSQSTVW